MAYHKKLYHRNHSTGTYTESHLQYYGILDTSPDMSIGLRRGNSIIAFLSGSHEQLGKRSLIQTLKPDMIQKILIMAFTGIKTNPSVSISLCRHFDTFMKHSQATVGRCLDFFHRFQSDMTLEHLEVCVESMRIFFRTSEDEGQNVIDKKRKDIADAERQGIFWFIEKEEMLIIEEKREDIADNERKEIFRCLDKGEMLTKRNEYDRLKSLIFLFTNKFKMLREHFDAWSVLLLLKEQCGWRFMRIFVKRTLNAWKKLATVPESDSDSDSIAEDEIEQSFKVSIPTSNYYACLS